MPNIKVAGWYKVPSVAHDTIERIGMMGVRKKKLHEYFVVVK